MKFDTTSVTTSGCKLNGAFGALPFLMGFWLLLHLSIQNTSLEINCSFYRCTITICVYRKKTEEDEENDEMIEKHRSFSSTQNSESHGGLQIRLIL
jgi:hypothetical protein